MPHKITEVPERIRSCAPEQFERFNIFRNKRFFSNTYGEDPLALMFYPFNDFSEFSGSARILSVSQDNEESLNNFVHVIGVIPLIKPNINSTVEVSGVGTKLYGINGIKEHCDVISEILPANRFIFKTPHSNFLVARGAVTVCFIDGVRLEHQSTGCFLDIMYMLAEAECIIEHEDRFQLIGELIMFFNSWS